MERVEDVVLEQLLVGDADLDGLAWRAVLHVPVLDQRDVLGAAHVARPLVERVRRPVQRDAVGRRVGVERLLRQEGLHLGGKLEVVVKDLVLERVGPLARRMPPRDRVDQRVKVERRQVRVLRLDVHHHRVVVRGDTARRGRGSGRG